MALICGFLFGLFLVVDEASALTSEKIVLLDEGTPVADDSIYVTDLVHRPEFPQDCPKGVCKLLDIQAAEHVSFGRMVKDGPVSSLVSLADINLPVNPPQPWRFGARDLTFTVDIGKGTVVQTRYANALWQRMWFPFFIWCLLPVVAIGAFLVLGWRYPHLRRRT